MTTKDGKPEEKQVAIRLPVALLERIEKHVERVRAQRPGLGYTRADAIRTMLFDQVEAKESQAREAEEQEQHEAK